MAVPCASPPTPQLHNFSLCRCFCRVGHESLNCRTSGCSMHASEGGFTMLWILRKIFGVVALAWILGWLLSFASCFVRPKAAGQMMAFMFIANVVGIPASIVWSVLKVIDVLSKSRTREPAPAPVAYPPAQVSPNSVLGLSAGMAPVPQPTATTDHNAGPDVYTYSAPGIPMCSRCDQRPGVFYCTSHQIAVCLDCVANHDERQKCVYVPAYRAPKPVTIFGRNVA